jgi:uncharacterized membrane protein YciS (DUF1049 family)
VRNALILLVVVALVVVTAGAVNHSVAFDVDWVAGTWHAVSLFWIAVAVALIVFVAGLVAALLARAGAARAQRKLETELDATYRRVRELEASPAATGAVLAGAGAAAGPAAQTVVQPARGEPATVIVPGPAAASAQPSQTPAAGAALKDGPEAGGTAVTVIASHGSARVTQVLPANPETDIGDAAVTGEEAASDTTAVAREPDTAVDATAVTHVPDSPGEVDAAAGPGDDPSRA